MIGTRRVLFPGNNDAYTRRVHAICGPSLIAHWPLDERTGANVRDTSGNGYGGTPVAIATGFAGIGDGLCSPFFDGASAYVNIYSAALAAAFDSTQGTLFLWARMANVGVWSDGTTRSLASIYANSSNRIQLNKGSTAGRFYFTFVGSGVSSERSILSQSNEDWVCWGLTWDASAVYGYKGGAQVTSAGAATSWGATLPGATTTCIGAVSTMPGQPSHGWTAHAGLCARALTAPEMAALGVIR